MWSIVPSGQDPASKRNKDASNNSGNFYLNYLLRQSAFLQGFIAKMTEALGTHEGNDRQSGTDVQRATEEPI